MSRSKLHGPYPRTVYGGMPPFQKDSETSALAAVRAIRTVGAGNLAVLSALRNSHKGLTDEEIRDFTLQKESTERPRRRELVIMGKVRDSGRKRRTASGSPATVWEIVEKKPETE